MSMYGIQLGVPQWVSSPICNSSCTDICPDFVIKRHDTKPSFKVSLQDCGGAPTEFPNKDSLLAEVSMWASAKLKRAITVGDDYFALADNIAFDQIIAGDVIIMDRVRRPEQMLVLGFDEENKLIQVSRAYNDTEASAWPKGTGMKIFRMRDASASVEYSYQDIINTDGTTTKDKLVGAYLVYDWQSNDTCVPGCFTLEFKLLQLVTDPIPSNIDFMGYISVIPSFTPSTVDFGCDLGLGVEWVRRYPQTKDGFLVQVVDSPTQE